jgi:hypothetical protein
MPLTCVDLATGNRVRSFTCSHEEWEGLRLASRNGGRLTMPCCAMKAIPKTSHRGLRFFAHAARGGCEAGGESIDHLHAKAVIAKAAMDAGWWVDTEVRGRAPSGEEWIADVLVKRTETSAKAVAFEVQLSAQMPEVTLERQRLYADSGVRGLWLMKQMNFVCSGEVPAFYLYDLDRDVPSVGNPHVWMGDLVGRRGSHKDFQADELRQSFPLQDFVAHALGGRLYRGEGYFMAAEATVTTARWWCRKCNGWITLVSEPQVASRWPQDPDAGATGEWSQEVVRALLEANNCRMEGPWALVRKFGGEWSDDDVAFVCPKCRTLQDARWGYEVARAKRWNRLKEYRQKVIVPGPNIGWWLDREGVLFRDCQAVRSAGAWPIPGTAFWLPPGTRPLVIGQTEAPAPSAALAARTAPKAGPTKPAVNRSWADAWPEDLKTMYSFGIGETVISPRFGLGVITGRTGDGPTTIHTVKFERVGWKRIAAAYGRLRRPTQRSNDQPDSPETGSMHAP